MSLADSIIQYVNANYPILYIESFEEGKVDREIIKAMMSPKVRYGTGYEWNAARGFCSFDLPNPEEEGDLLGAQIPICSPEEGLPEKQETLNRKLKELVDQAYSVSDEYNQLAQSFLILKDSHLYFNDPEVIGSLKKLALRISAEEPLDFVVFIVSSVRVIPKELEKFITILDMEYPGIEEITKQIKAFADINYLRIDDKLVDELAIKLKGLTEFEIDNLLASAFTMLCTQSSNDYLELINEQKRQMIEKSGILEMVKVKEKPEDIGGLEILQEWLRKKAKVFQKIQEAEKYGVDMPKGLLIAGMPGCGKSLCAKVAAQMFGVPLLRLDMGKIMGKYVGESEENMRKAIALAEAISPCVLWIDELEKAFAGINGSGNEVTVRLFGTFLTWMQEKKTPTFVIATANKIISTDSKNDSNSAALPPELLRKGRFDEIFYVDLPNPGERRKILEIHIKKRREADLPQINLDVLAKKTEGYSGADIEGIVKDAIETAFVDGGGAAPLKTEDLEHEIEHTHSLSEIMKEDLKKMREAYTDHKFKKASK